MKRIGWVASLFVIAVLAGCSSISTNADYNPATDFSKYRTFGWHETNSVRDPIWHDRIKSAVIAELQSRGLTLDEAHPDLWVAAHTRLSEEHQINTYNTGWGYGWGWHGGMGMQTATVQKIPVGTLIVDLVDARQKELVWRGTATKTMDQGATPEEKQKNLQEALQKMLANYPPARK
jgi:hypothetical protein